MKKWSGQSQGGQGIRYSCSYIIASFTAM